MWWAISELLPFGYLGRWIVWYIGLATAFIFIGVRSEWVAVQRPRSASRLCLGCCRWGNWPGSRRHRRLRRGRTDRRRGSTRRPRDSLLRVRRRERDHADRGDVGRLEPDDGHAHRDDRTRLGGLDGHLVSGTTAEPRRERDDRDGCRATKRWHGGYSRLDAPIGRQRERARLAGG